MTAFRQDRYQRELYQPGRVVTVVEPLLYTTADLAPAEPGLYAFDVVPFAIGYVSITPYNAEAF